MVSEGIPGLAVKYLARRPLAMILSKQQDLPTTQIQQPIGVSSMPTIRNTTVVALLFSATLATGAMSASPAPCPPGLQKTEGEGGTAYSAKYGVQKTAVEGTDYYATHGIQKSAGRSMTQVYQAGASCQQTIAPEARD
jgi:hypothetical protein